MRGHTHTAGYAITINIGDISHICAKVDAAQLPGLFELKSEPASQVL
jgi:hypothetical protein